MSTTFKPYEDDGLCKYIYSSSFHSRTKVNGKIVPNNDDTEKRRDRRNRKTDKLDEINRETIETISVLVVCSDPHRTKIETTCFSLSALFL